MYKSIPLTYKIQSAKCWKRISIYLGLGISMLLYKNLTVVLIFFNKKRQNQGHCQKIYS